MRDNWALISRKWPRACHAEHHSTALPLLSGQALLPIGLVVLKGKLGVPVGPTMSSSMIVTKSKYKASAAQRVTFACPPLGEGECYVILASTFEPGQVSRALRCSHPRALAARYLMRLRREISPWASATRAATSR